MAELLQQGVNGLAIGGAYVLIALGVTLVFGLSRLINFAHGEFVVLAALVTWAVMQQGWPFLPAALGAVAITAAVALVIERALFRPTRDVPLNGFIISLGLITAAQGLMASIFQPEPKRVASPLHGVVHMGPALLPLDRLLIVAVTAMLVLALFLILDRSGFGRRVRATAADQYGARVIGIDVGRVTTAIFVVGSALGAVGGALMVTVFVMTPFNGLNYVVKGFIAAIIGGLGNVRGAAAAGLMLGLAETLGSAYISSRWQDGFGYLLLIVVLAVRPSGILRGANYAMG